MPDNSHTRRFERALKDFFGVSETELRERIIPQVTMVELTAGDILFREGDKARDLYFVVRGRLRAFRNSDTGARMIGEIGRGEPVGEMAAVTGEPRSASIIAARATQLAKIPLANFEALIAARPRLAFQVMQTVITRMRSETARRSPPRVPVNICILPITQGTDALTFAMRLAERREPLIGRAGVFTRASAAAHERAGKDTEDAWQRWLESVETDYDGVTLVSDPADEDWSRFCIRNADEILLLADADKSGAVTPLERFIEQDAELRGAQTLVLLHPQDTQSPTGTAEWLNRRRVTRHFHIRPALDRDMARLARILTGRAVGIVLSGGGARGFAHIGVMNALAQAGIEPDFIGGVSIGAVMGAWRAMDVRGDDMVDAGRKAFVASGGPTNDYSPLPLISLVRGMKTRRITEAAVRESSGSDIDIEDTWITFFCIAGNFSTAQEAVLDRGPLAKCILASYAIPGALPPIIIDGHLFVDGGVINNLPVDVMERYGVGTLIASDLLHDTVRKVDLDWVPRGATLLFDRFRRSSKRRYRLPSIADMLLNASVLQSTNLQRQMRSRADICFHPRLSRVGLLDWKQYDRVVHDAHESTAQVLAQMPPEKLARMR